ncbi:MAG: adenosine kinase [Armatimonadetes bacterium]|nr:adenosine kinase [Armatimonadota bacterium]
MRFDVFGMCNALFDLQAEVTYEALSDLGLTAGGMFLLEADRHAELVRGISGSIVNTAAGGSGANTMIGVASLGGSACFTSRVGCDQFGPAYAQSLADAGVEPFLADGTGATGLCVVLITPDKQRTMCTYLGEGRNLAPANVRLDAVRESRMLYVTGYLWDTRTQQDAVVAAIGAAREASVPVAVSLADTFCITRHEADFHRLLDDAMDVVFGNSDEATLLSGCADPTEAAAKLGSGRRTAFVTLGSDGALAARCGSVTHIPSNPVNVVDTTGAGDAFAAGVLYGLTHGQEPADAARTGSRLAATVVSRLGPRPV